MKDDGTRRRRFFAWTSLLGYDVFISYRRSEATEYSERLHRELTAAGLTVFLDRDETPGGDELTPALRRALRRSRMLVLLLTPEVLRSNWVQDEVRLFSGRRGRSLVPVNINRFIEAHDLTGTALARIPELSWVDESADALRAGVPSAAVIGQIPKGLSKLRVRTISRVIVASVMLVLAATAAFAVVQMREAQAQAAVAIAGQLAAQSELVLAQDPRQVRLAAALGAESMARVPSVQAARMLQTSLESLPILTASFSVERATDIALSPDATGILVTYLGEPTVTRYDLTGQRLGVVLDCRLWQVCAPSLGSLVHAVAGPSGDSGAIIHVRDLLTGTATGSIAWERMPVRVAVDPAGRLLFAVDRDGRACLWSVADRQQKGCFDGPTSAGWQFNANGRLLAAVIGNDDDDDDDATDTWHVVDTERMAEVYRTGGSPLIMSPTGRYVASLHRSDRFQVHDIQNNTDLPVFQHERDEYVDGAVFDSEDLFVVTRTTGSILRAWVLADGGSPTPMIVTATDRGGRLVRQTGDRTSVMTLDRSSTPAVSLWRLTRTPRERFVETMRAYHDAEVHVVATNRDGDVVATLDANGVVRVWDYRNGNTVNLPSSDANAVWKDCDIERTPRPTRLAGLWTRSTTWISQLWKSSQPSSSPPEIPAGSPPGYPAQRIVSPDGRHVALISVSLNGGDPGAVVLYEATSDRELTRIRHTARVNDARFSCDGRYLASAGADHAIRIWDAATNRQVAELRTEWEVDHVRFIQQDRYLQAHGEDLFQREAMLTYRWRPEELLEAVGARDVRRLSAEEWVPFLGSRTPVFAARPQ
ncbi:MAG: toll/interleukin-1 receptor domain-containing protein [Vicinamibacterales bacterium]